MRTLSSEFLAIIEDLKQVCCSLDGEQHAFIILTFPAIYNKGALNLNVAANGSKEDYIAILRAVADAFEKELLEEREKATLQ